MATMKDPRTRRVATAILLLLCALVLVKLVFTVAGIWGGPSSTAASSPPSAPASASARNPSPAAPGESSAGSNDAVLHLDELAELNGRPLPDFQRNPFQYGPTPEEVRAQHDAQVRAANPPPPPPPAPPPIPFKAIGYQRQAAGQRVAYLCVSGASSAAAPPSGSGGSGGGSGCAEDQAPYAVREGQEFGQHYKVLRITDSMVEVEDESYHQTVQLPYPE
jgi:hypothetical protein